MITFAKLDRFLPRSFRKQIQRFYLNHHPIFLSSGIHIQEISHDYQRIIVKMGLRWYNQNYVGTHFGGNLFSMTDPFYMFMLMHILGPEYMIWDQSSTIEFMAPGKGKVTATFRITDETIKKIIKKTNRSGIWMSRFYFMHSEAKKT